MTPYNESTRNQIDRKNWVLVSLKHPQGQMVAVRYDKERSRRMNKRVWAEHGRNHVFIQESAFNSFTETL